VDEINEVITAAAAQAFFCCLVVNLTAGHNPTQQALRLPAVSPVSALNEPIMDNWIACQQIIRLFNKIPGVKRPKILIKLGESKAKSEIARGYDESNQSPGNSVPLFMIFT
jgi:hypothetical protein